MRYAVYAVLYVVWAAAVVHSFRQYRKDRALESADAIAAEAEIAGDRGRVEAVAAETDAGPGRPAERPARLTHVERPRPAAAGRGLASGSH